MKKFLAGIGLVVALMVILAGCGSPNWNRTNYYRPASFGENNQCYYMQTQAEAEMLIREGLCQPGWRPVQAPWTWQIRYMPYYESQEYRDYYVPASSRKIYAIYTREFDTKWSRDIKTAQSTASYVDNKGDKANGNTVPRGQFGGGVRSKGGAGIRASNGKPAKKVADKYFDKSSKSNGGNSGLSKSSGGGYKSGSTVKSSCCKSSWSNKSSNGGIRSSRR